MIFTLDWVEISGGYFEAGLLSEWSFFMEVGSTPKAFNLIKFLGKKHATFFKLKKWQKFNLAANFNTTNYIEVKKRQIKQVSIIFLKITLTQKSRHLVKNQFLKIP